MTTNPSISAKPKPKPRKTTMKPAGESTASKRQRLDEMLRELRSDAETLLANADRLLTRFS